MGEQVTRKLRSRMVEECLANSRIHEQWKNAYRTADNEQFFSLAFDYIAGRLAAPPDSLLLDAGCGTCSHSLRLAARGFKVVGMDISASALRMGEEQVARRGFADRVKVLRGNVRSLPFATGSFSYVLCWGVLMHIPEVERAIDELARVVAPGGKLVIGENNMHSVQSLLIRALRRLLGRNRLRISKRPAGLEGWYKTRTGTLMTRETDMGWFIRRLRHEGLELRERTAGQLSDLYAWIKSPLMKRMIHTLNKVWFMGGANPHLAFGNILILEKVS